MFSKTRLSQYFTEILHHLNRKFLTVRTTFSFALFSLFTGFICGNLFGSFLDTLRLYFFWNGFVGLALLLFIETINFLVYGISPSKKKKVDSLKEYNGILKNSFSPNAFSKSFRSWPERNATCKKFCENLTYIERSINAFKIGLLFGFFVDSFKVGS